MGQAFSCFKNQDEELLNAVKQDNPAGIKRASVAGADVNKFKGDNTPLVFAAKEGRISAVKALLKEGADLKNTDSHGRTPLHNAAENNHADVIKVLVSADAKSVHSLDVFGSTPLHLAASAGSLEAAKVLMELGGLPTEVDSRARTPLHLAAESRSSNAAAMIQLLLENNAPVGAEDSLKRTPLQYAADAGNLAQLKALIPASKNVLDHADKNGTTALHMLAQQPSMIEGLKQLLAAGAKLELKDYQGKTAADLAASADIKALLSGAAVSPADVQVQA